MIPQQPALPLPEHSLHCPARCNLWQQGPHHLILANCQGLAPSLAPGRHSKNACCFHWNSVLTTTSSFERQKPRRSDGRVSFPTASSQWQGQTWHRLESSVPWGPAEWSGLLSFQSTGMVSAGSSVLYWLLFLLKCTQRENSPRNSFDSCRENCVLGVKSENVFNFFPLTF